MTATQSIRREVFYSGRVQGVGFRWTVRHIAQSHAVTGFVKNLEDGRVQLVVEGATAELDRLLAQSASEWARTSRPRLSSDRRRDNSVSSKSSLGWSRRGN
jgi:acylphosphatase